MWRPYRAPHYIKRTPASILPATVCRPASATFDIYLSPHLPPSRPI
nr:MAG TPA: hypothetical protein [Caudoviricetes sp.]